MISPNKVSGNINHWNLLENISNYVPNINKSQYKLYFNKDIQLIPTTSKLVKLKKTTNFNHNISFTNFI